MSMEMTTPVATVPATSISTITAKILATKDTVGKILAMAYIELGGLLTQAKDLVPPGEWSSYLENEVEFSHRTANNCMKLYAEYSKNPDSQALACMPYTKAVRFLSLPESEREDFLEQHDVESMSSREFDQAIKDRNAAIAAQKKAETEKKNLSEQLHNANAVVTDKQAEIDRLIAERDKALADAETAQKEAQELKDNPAVPKSVIQKLAAEASKQAAAAYQAKIDDAIAAKESAEKIADEAQQKLDAAGKVARISSPDAAAFSVLYPQIETSFNQLKGLCMKIACSDPELGEKLKDLMRQLVERFRKAVE